MDEWGGRGNANLEIHVARFPEAIDFFGDRLTQWGCAAATGTDATQVVVFDCRVLCEGHCYGRGEC
jgi:hypothetical protein